MNLRLRGEDTPEAVFKIFASLTKYATLRHAEVEHDLSSDAVHLPITRFPLVKRRWFLGHRRDYRHPIRATLTVHSVVSCDLNDNTTPDMGDEVNLLFGIDVAERRIYAGSVEKNRGQACFSVTTDVAEVDLEISDEPLAAL